MPLAREEAPNLALFSFDCQKYIALPKLPKQVCRQFNTYNIGTVKSKLGVDNVFLYTWTENQQPNECNEIDRAVCEIHHILIKNHEFNYFATTVEHKIGTVRWL